MRTEEDQKVYQKTKKVSFSFRKILAPFCSLHSRLTLHYSIVTIGVLLVVEVVVMVLLVTHFNRCIHLTPENLISNLRGELTPMVQQFFSSEPPDVEDVRAYLEDVQGTIISTYTLFIFGNLKLKMKMQDILQFYYFLNDHTLVHAIPHGIVFEEDLGNIIPFDYLPSLSSPLRAAMEEIEEQNLLYETVEPRNRLVGTKPALRFEPTETETLNDTRNSILDVERNLVGVVVFTTKHYQWQELPFTKLMIYIGRS